EPEPGNDQYVRENARDPIGGLGRRLLQQAQNAADRLAVIVGRGQAHWINRALLLIRRGGGLGGFLVGKLGAQARPRLLFGRSRRGRGGIWLSRRVVIPDLKRILDRRQRRLCRVLHLLRGVRHCRSSAS